MANFTFAINQLRITSLLFAALFFSLQTQAKDNVGITKINHIGLFQNLIGHWSVMDYSLDKQGKWISAGGADWNFYPILNGMAVQDDWISPSLDKPAPKSGRQYGTNIRIFNPQTKTWEMAWMGNFGKKVSVFNATETDNKVIMRGNYQGQDARITFFEIKPTTFSWTMEFNTAAHDGKNSQENWKVVYKIEGTRKY